MSAALRYIWPFAFACVPILFIHFAPPPLALVVVAGVAGYLGLSSFSVAHAARQTRYVWIGTRWVNGEAEPRRFRRLIVRFYALAAFEWSGAVVTLLFAVGILELPV